MSDQIDPTIFRDYDIRGIYPGQLNDKTVYLLGRALATYLKVTEIGVGYDMRLSSKKLFIALSNGLRDQGVDVVNLGLISTEMNYFASGRYRYPANVIITASHNPAEYNGFKIVTSGAIPIHGENGLSMIKDILIGKKFSPIQKKGSVWSVDILDDWINHVLKFIDLTQMRRIKVVIDAGNGMGGVAWKRLTKKLPIKIIPLYFKPDGHFPHHLPDPIKKENLIDLQKTILREKANIGFAIDGDADRLFVLDENAKIVSGTITCAILATTLLERKGPATVLYNVVCGKIVDDTVKRLGGVPIRVRVGHSFIKEYMRKYNALFAGEHSGHFYFRDNFYADSSLIAGLLMLEFLSLQNKSFSQIVKTYNKYFSSGELNFKVKLPDDILTKIESKFSDCRSFDHIDGLSVFYDNWWFNLRSSKTEPLLRLNIEAESIDVLENKQKKLLDIIIKLGGQRCN